MNFKITESEALLAANMRGNCFEIKRSTVSWRFSTVNFLWLFPCAFLIGLSSAYAEAPLSSQSVVHIRVFAIEAARSKGEVNESAKVLSVAFANARSKKVLSFLSSKLAALPYSTYSLLSEQSFVVPLKKRMQFSLAQGHHITLRPLSFDDSRVCFWLKWVETGGIDIVDTRLTVNLGEPMVTVWEHDEVNGFVIAVEVSRPPSSEQKEN